MQPAGQADPRSLAEVNASVGTSHVSFWRRMFAFAGPAYLVSVGYMDPGNWATDLEGGARFGYKLLWVLVMSNLMAILLQTLSARLGIVAGRDLAQACRETYPRPISFALWALCEVAIAACDLAEVLGAAIGFNLLFGWPLLLGVAVTATDTLLILWFQNFGIRVIEAFVLALITVIAICFGIEIFWARPLVSEMAGGLIPSLNKDSLYVAIGILGATVMPHNLYLHSALVQTRRIGLGDRAKRIACRYNLIDSIVALNGALLVNAAILVLAATVFFKNGIVVTEIQQAHKLLEPMLGTSLAGAAFAIALLCAGQSSTLTGTMAGQIVMEGFLDFRMRPWLRRLVTRAVAVVPAAITLYIAGGKVRLSNAPPEPGDSQPAVAFRRYPADSIHQRPPPHGPVPQPALGARARLDHRLHHRRTQPAPRLGCHWRMADHGGGLGSARLGARHSRRNRLDRFCFSGLRLNR